MSEANQTDATKPLSDVEFNDLCRLEQVIAAGVAHFVAVGEALAEVRTRGLYRATHGTFEAYCRGRWKLSDRHVQRLMGAAEVVRDLQRSGPDPIGSPRLLPQNERQARTLAGAEPEHRAPAWRAGLELSGGRPPPSARLGQLLEKIRAGVPPEELARAVREGEAAVVARGARVTAAAREQTAVWHAARARWHLKQARRHLLANGRCAAGVEAVGAADGAIVEQFGDVEPRG